MSLQTDRAYQILKDRIVNLQFKPGEVLKETALMEELRMGRTPIREALQRLARDDLVVIQPRRGMYVAEIGVTDLKDIFEARIPLETECARLAAERITDGQLNEIEQAIEESERCFSSDPDCVDQLMECDRLIHEIISTSTGNKFFIDGVRWLYDLTARIWRLSPNPAAHAREIHQHHRNLLQALRKRDPDLAEQAMKRHIMDFWSQMRAQV